MRLLTPRAILLDLDGTLADSLSVMRLAYQMFLKQFGRTPTDDEFDSLNGPPLLQVVRHLKISHALSGDVDVLLENYFGLIDHAYCNVKPGFGAVDLLLKAQKHHCIIGVVTSNTRKRTQFWLETVCLAHMIDFIVSGDEVKQGKPHPEPYIIASKKTSCKLNQIVAIEDSLQGAQSAIGAGLKTLVIGAETTGYSWPQGVEPVPSLFEAAEKLFASHGTAPNIELLK
jgi:beta-phosphoglucomutase